MADAHRVGDTPAPGGGARVQPQRFQLLHHVRRSGLRRAGVGAARRATYVVDTSRDGLGPAPDGPLNWCNPPARGLGKRPTTITDAPHGAADLWIKEPGQSDGECDRGDPPSGVWFPSYAADLTAGAGGR